MVWEGVKSCQVLSQNKTIGMIPSALSSSVGAEMPRLSNIRYRGILNYSILSAALRSCSSPSLAIQYQGVPRHI